MAKAVFAAKMGLSPSAGRGQVHVFGLRPAWQENARLAEKWTSPRTARERLQKYKHECKPVCLFGSNPLARASCL